MPSAIGDQDQRLNPLNMSSTEQHQNNQIFVMNSMADQHPGSPELYLSSESLEDRNSTTSSTEIEMAHRKVNINH
jgi:hypothetical protein